MYRFTINTGNVFSIEKNQHIGGYYREVELTVVMASIFTPEKSLRDRLRFSWHYIRSVKVDCNIVYRNTTPV